MPSRDGLGVKWPVTLFVCQECARPTLWREDRCCSGFYDEVEVVPAERFDQLVIASATAFAEWHSKGDVAGAMERLKVAVRDG